MQTITTIGLDIAKSVFQVHGVDAAGEVVIRRQLKRSHVPAFFQKLPPCLVGIEACASSHHWSRELQALGHTVRLMPTLYPAELRVRVVHLAYWPGVGNVSAKAGRARSKARKATVTRSNRVGCAICVQNHEHFRSRSVCRQ